jgi:type IV pilus assembly protein PilV
MKKLTKQARPRGLQRGSTLIEVMVSVVILALGMMGMLGMFINSLKITTGALYRNIAAQHAYMIADAMRANNTNLTSCFTPTASATAGCFNTTGCTSANMANTEYQVWETQLAALLPAGQGKVCRDSTPSTRSSSTPTSFFTCDNSGQLVVKVCWDETRIQNSNASITNSTNTTNTGGGQCMYTNL